MVSELGSGLGIVALGLFGFVIVLPSRSRLFARLGADTAVRLHRRLATGLLALLTAHILAVVLADPSRIALFRFFGQPWRAQAAIGSTIAFCVLLVSSRYRRRIRLPYAAWRGVHVALAGGALLLATLHTVGRDRYLMTGVGLVALIANGIGITPMISILRTAADDWDPRRFVLVYGNRDADGITFREELDTLTRKLELAVFHVLTRPHASWSGLRGRITPAVLRQALPEDLRRWEFFLCGSPPAVGSSLTALQALGVPRARPCRTVRRGLNGGATFDALRGRPVRRDRLDGDCD